MVRCARINTADRCSETRVRLSQRTSGRFLRPSHREVSTPVGGFRLSETSPDATLKYKSSGGECKSSNKVQDVLHRSSRTLWISTIARVSRSQ